MARMHGKNVRIYLGSRDVSGDITQITSGLTVEAPDTTTFADAGWMTSGATGRFGWEASFDGFHDAAAGAFGQQLDGMLGGATGPITIADDDADAVGDAAILLNGGVLEKMAEPINVADLVKRSGSIKGNGRPGLAGRLLHQNASVSATGNGAGVDNAVQSTFGGIANLHVLSMGATTQWTVKVQDSADNSTFADLTGGTFTAATGVTSQSLAISGTIRRYTREVHTKDSGTGAMSYVVALARHTQ